MALDLNVNALMAFLALSSLGLERLTSANLEKSVSELMSRADLRDSNKRTSSIFFSKVSPSWEKQKQVQIVKMESELKKSGAKIRKNSAILKETSKDKK